MSFTDAQSVRRSARSHPSTRRQLEEPTELIAGAPLPPMEPDTASAGIAAAERAAERAATELREVEQRRDQVAERLRVLAERRNTIIVRRQSGQEQPDDAGELALIAADTDGLQALMIEANAAVTNAQTGADTAQRHLQHARQALALFEAERQHVLLARHADTLGSLLLAAVERMQVLEQRLNKGASACWAPTRAMTDILRKAAFGSGKGW